MFRLSLGVVVLLGLVGCGNKPESLVGVWELEPSDAWVQKSAAGGNAPPAGEFIFNEDGTCRMTRAADGSRFEMRGSFKVNGDMVLVTLIEVNGLLAPKGNRPADTGHLSSGRSRFSINGLTFKR